MNSPRFASVESPAAINETTQTQQQNDPVQEPDPPKKPTTKDITQYAEQVIIKYSLDRSKFYNTVQGESGFQSDPPHNNQSRGTAQYMLPTWLAYCSDTDDRLDPYKSLGCMGRMWSQGLEYHWDAYCLRYYDAKCVKYRNLQPKTSSS